PVGTCQPTGAPRLMAQAVERRGRDLNPRGASTAPNRLAGDHLRPLGHLSEGRESTVRRCRETAEREGFEPPGPCRPPAFKAGAIVRSATAPASTLPADLLAKGVDPVVGRLPLGFGVAAQGGAVLARGRVRAEELQVLQLRVEVA